MSRRRLGVGFVGGGWVTTNRHMPAAKTRVDRADVDLVGLVTAEPKLASLDRRRLTSSFGIRHFTSDLTESWFCDDVDIAVIGTPPETHYDLVMRCLGMGKHVLVEKPFALSTAHAREMVDAAASAGLKLGVIHNFQFASAPRRARELLDAGELGELRGVYGFQTSNHRRRLPSWYRDLPMGLFTDESPHLLYLQAAFSRSDGELSARVGAPMAGDDNTPRYVSAHFDGEVPTSLHMVFDGALSEWHVVLLGERKTLMVDLFRDTLLRVPNDGRHEAVNVLRSSASAIGSHVAGFFVSGWRHVTGRMDYGNREVFRRFVSSVVDDCTLVGIDAEDGYAVVAVMEQITEVARGSRSEWQLDPRK